MSNEIRDLGWVKAGGTPHEIGLALGRAGRDAVHEQLLPSSIWAEITGTAHDGRVARITAAVKARFPQIWAEIEGLAEGLDLPVAQVMAWNCRGDLLASTPDGCTTVMLPGPEPVIGHNEDGLPFFRGSCFIAEVTPDDAPAFRGFCYPGSIPGHTFAFNDAGLVQTVNNIRLTGVEANMSRMVLGRAVLTAASIDEALDILRAHPGSGAFHFALAHRDDPRLISVEFGEDEVAVRTLDAPALHANHALYHEYGVAHQIITRSSGDRQIRGDALLAEGQFDPLTILRDTDGPGLPIRRDTDDDPDDENTLGTAIFRVTGGKVEWSIYDQPTGGPAYKGKTA